MKYVIGVGLVLIVFSLWRIEWKLDQIFKKDGDQR